MDEGKKYKVLKTGGHIAFKKQLDKESNEVVMLEQKIYSQSTGEVEQVHKMACSLADIDKKIEIAQKEVDALVEMKNDFTGELSKAIA